jgi:hypothetical protein
MDRIKGLSHQYQFMCSIPIVQIITHYNNICRGNRGIKKIFGYRFNPILLLILQDDIISYWRQGRKLKTAFFCTSS